MSECLHVFDPQECAELVAAFDASPNKQDEDKAEAFYRNSYGVYNLPETLYYVSELTQTVREKYPTAKFSNTYTRCYRKGSILGIHTDRSELDVTMSVCLEKRPDRQWPLNVSNKLWHGPWDIKTDPTPFKTDFHSVNIPVGKGAFCEGKKYPHWRDPFECDDDERAVYVFYHWTIPVQTPPKLDETANTKADVSLSLKDPNLFVVDGFVTPAECAELISLAKTKLARSTVVDDKTGQPVEHVARTSSGAFFGKAETPLIADIERRISERVGIPVENGEGLQVLRYEIGQEYCPHYDYFAHDANSKVDHLARGGQRILTFLVYLNTPELGGATCFPDVGLEVAARQGRGLMFSYAPNPTSKSLHGGLPVLQGEKWVITKWFREGKFI
jgi:prolyl 4-hydroxylase